MPLLPFSGCHTPPAAPHAMVAAAQDDTFELGQPGWSLRGVAGDGRRVFAAIASSGTGSGALPAAGSAAPAEISAILNRGGWRTELAGTVGPIAYASGEVVATLGGRGTVAGIAMRGDPGAVVAALDAGTGAKTWAISVDATEWVVIASVAASADGIAIGGTFQGTLRIADSVVASAGRTDGFVAKLGLDGKLAWLVRVGGDQADAVAGVAIAHDRVAVAGSVASGAELLGEPLPTADDRALLADAFVAELDGNGKRVWSKTFGSDADDRVAGVTIDASGRVVVAAIARGEYKLGGRSYTARGPADGLVAWFSPDGEPVSVAQLGGAELDGLRGIVAVGDRVVVGGFFSGTLPLAGQSLHAIGDDAFLALLDGGKDLGAWPITGDGREDIVALSPIPGGFIAGVAHTSAAKVDSSSLPSPADPLAGFAVVVRGVR